MFGMCKETCHNKSDIWFIDRAINMIVKKRRQKKHLHAGKKEISRYMLPLSGWKKSIHDQ